MDPKACLLAADASMLNRDYETAAQHLRDYETWRNNGGFEPTWIVGGPIVGGPRGYVRGDRFARIVRNDVVACSDDEKLTDELMKMFL